MRTQFCALLVLSVGILRVLGLTKTAVMERITFPLIPTNFTQPIQAGKSKYSCKLLCLETAGCDLSIFDETSQTCKMGNIRNWNILPAPTPLILIISEVYFSSGMSCSQPLGMAWGLITTSMPPCLPNGMVNRLA